MNTIQLLAEWAVRSSILMLGGFVLIRAARVKDPSIVLAGCIAMLGGSMALPALSVALPALPLNVMRAPVRADEWVSRMAYEGAPVADSRTIDWQAAAVSLYFLVAGALLLRLSTGLAMSQRLRNRSRATRQMIGGIEIRESDRIASPVTLGIRRPAIVLPDDWRTWERPRLDAVLAHECSHIRRRDPAVQVLSAIHRALLWHSPLSWHLHRSIVKACEQASDDAAVEAVRDRGFYAEVLLDFMQRGVRRANWQGVPMARYGRADERIHRILDATALSRGVTGRSAAAIVLAGALLTYAVAAARPQSVVIAQDPAGILRGAGVRIAPPVAAQQALMVRQQVDEGNRETPQNARSSQGRPGTSGTPRGEETPRKQYFLRGKIQSPGSYALTYPTTVLLALVIGGGFSELANPNEIRVVRTEDGKVTEFRFNYDEVKNGENPGQNIRLMPGDVIIVP
jgi:hypothetical protein